MKYCEKRKNKENTFFSVLFSLFRLLFQNNILNLQCDYNISIFINPFNNDNHDRISKHPAFRFHSTRV